MNENCQVERRIGRRKKVCEEDEGSLPKKVVQMRERMEWKRMEQKCESG